MSRSRSITASDRTEITKCRGDVGEPDRVWTLEIHYQEQGRRAGSTDDRGTHAFIEQTLLAERRLRECTTGRRIKSERWNDGGRLAVCDSVNQAFELI